MENDPNMKKMWGRWRRFHFTLIENKYGNSIKRTPKITPLPNAKALVQGQL